MISIRRRLVVGLLAALALLWSSAAVVFLANTQNELDEVLDARLAASARMVQRLIRRGDLAVSPAAPLVDESASLESHLPTEIACELWTLDGDLLSVSDNAPILDAGAMRDGFATREAGGEMWRMFVLSDASSGVRIVTAERARLRDALLEGMAMSVLGPLVFMLPLIAGVVWLGVGRGLAPLHTVQRALRQRNVESLDPVPVERTPVEVMPLIVELNELLSRLNATVERERRFIGDAAHELRTPLAGVKTNLQLAADSEGDIRDSALGQAELAIDRMGRLVNQMLELSRLEDTLSQLPARGENSDPWQVMQQVARDLAYQGRQRNVHLVLDDEGGLDHLPIPEAMLAIAVRNLAENAILHTPPGGRVRITLRPDRSIHVVDEGAGIPEAELERVTERFFRASHVTPGSGLGLAIVAAIARRYGARLLIENRTSGGLHAALVFSV